APNGRGCRSPIIRRCAAGSTPSSGGRRCNAACWCRSSEPARSAAARSNRPQPCMGSLEAVSMVRRLRRPLALLLHHFGPPDCGLRLGGEFGIAEPLFEPRKFRFEAFDLAGEPPFFPGEVDRLAKRQDQIGAVDRDLDRTLRDGGAEVEPFDPSNPCQADEM